MATVASQGITAANRDKYALIRDGVPVAFCNAKGQRVREWLRVIDFDHPDNNAFLCVWELWVQSDLYRRRADLVGFVNGLPLLFIECKALHKDLRSAYEQNYSDYRGTVPHLFHHNAVVMFGNGEQSKIGSIISQCGHFHDWKRLAEEEPGAVDMETLLKGVCDRGGFLDPVESVILFDDSSGATRKILARNHQFLGVNRAVQAVRERDARARRLAVFWHTQGSGKSFSIVMFTRKVHRKLGGNFTFLVLTDREDLNTQIYKTFAGTGTPGDGDIDPVRPEEELLDELAEAIELARGFLAERGTSLDDVTRNTGFARNAAILACNEAANENDETRKRFEILCRQVFTTFKACINVAGIHAHRPDRDAIDVVYKQLQWDRDQADITGIIRQLHQVVDEAIETRPDRMAGDTAPYDISGIDFERLKREFERSPWQRTTVQSLKAAVEQRLMRLLQQNPLRTDFQQNYEQIVTAYNREKDRMTIEQTFEALLKLVQDMDAEEQRAVREGLDQESLALFDLLAKPDLDAAGIARIKSVATTLLKTLKAERLRVDNWRDKEAWRDAVRVAIHDFQWSEDTGLPVSDYDEDDVLARVGAIYQRIYWAYPTVPSPYY